MIPSQPDNGCESWCGIVAGQHAWAAWCAAGAGQCWGMKAAGCCRHAGRRARLLSAGLPVWLWLCQLRLQGFFFEWAGLAYVAGACDGQARVTASAGVRRACPPRAGPRGSTASLHADRSVAQTGCLHPGQLA
jgi:hypothetical protein